MMESIKNTENHEFRLLYAFGIIFAIQFAVIMVYGGTKSYIPSWCRDFDNVITPYIVGFTGLLFWLRVCKIIAPVLKNDKIMKEIGRTAYSIMINQYLAFMIIKTFFALVNKFSNALLCSDFDWNLYKTDVMYFYAPNGISQFYIIYLLAGIFISIMMQRIINQLKPGRSRHGS